MCTNSCNAVEETSSTKGGAFLHLVCVVCASIFVENVVARCQRKLKFWKIRFSEQATVLHCVNLIDVSFFANRRSALQVFQIAYPLILYTDRVY